MRDLVGLYYVSIILTSKVRNKLCIEWVNARMVKAIALCHAREVWVSGIINSLKSYKLSYFS